MTDKKLASWFLRIGLAVVFAYAAVASFINPSDWVGYLPQFLRHNSSAEDLLKVFSIYELILAGWLIYGRYLKYATLLSALTMVGITLSNINIFVITFRDVGLMFMALALYALERQEK